MQTRLSDVVKVGGGKMLFHQEMEQGKQKRRCEFERENDPKLAAEYGTCDAVKGEVKN